MVSDLVHCLYMNAYQAGKETVLMNHRVLSYSLVISLTLMRPLINDNQIGKLNEADLLGERIVNVKKELNGIEQWLNLW